MTVEEALLIVERILDQGRLNKIQEIVFRQAWEGLSYLEIAKSSGYDMGYIKDAGAKLWQLLSKAFGEKVTKNNVQSVIKRCARQLHVTAAVSESTDTSQGSNACLCKSCGTTHLVTANLGTGNKCQDWGEAIDVSVFYGREEEFDLLERWLVIDRCRLVMLTGMGGMGKTALSIKLAERIQEHFDYVIWRSLRNAPPLKTLTADLIQFLSRCQETNLPQTAEGRISHLMHYLRQHRCLLVLDNAESILRKGDRRGSYREGYREYGQLLRCMAETPHQSAIVITSREKPKELAAAEGETLPVRSLQVTGLPTAEARKIFQNRWLFWGTETEWQALIEHYAGNPLALKMVAPAIRDFMDGHVSKFLDLLKQGTLVFDDIRNLLDRQFNRLTDLEKEVMYWLAIHREPVSLQKLQADLVSESSTIELMESLASLQRRSLIEKNLAGFTQKPVLMEYMTEQLIDRACQEIATQKFALLKNHVLLDVRAEERIQDIQIRLLLKPITKQLMTTFGSNSRLEEHLNQILLSLPRKPLLGTGYAIGNILNLSEQVQTERSDRDLLELCHQVNHSEPSNPASTEPLVFQEEQVPNMTLPA